MSFWLGDGLAAADEFGVLGFATAVGVGGLEPPTPARADGTATIFDSLEIAVMTGISVGACQLKR